MRWHGRHMVVATVVAVAAAGNARADDLALPLDPPVLQQLGLHPVPTARAAVAPVPARADPDAARAALAATRAGPARRLRCRRSQSAPAPALPQTGRAGRLGLPARLRGRAPRGDVPDRRWSIGHRRLPPRRRRPPRRQDRQRAAIGSARLPARRSAASSREVARDGASHRCASLAGARTAGGARSPRSVRARSACSCAAPGGAASRGVTRADGGEPASHREACRSARAPRAAAPCAARRAPARVTHRSLRPRSPRRASA